METMEATCNCATGRQRYQHCDNCDTRLDGSFPHWCTCPVWNHPADVLCGGDQVPPKHREPDAWASKYPRDKKQVLTDS